MFEQYHPQMILENGFNVDVMFPVIRNHGTMDNTQALDWTLMILQWTKLMIGIWGSLV